MTGREEKNHVASHKTHTHTRVNSHHVAASSNSTSCALHNHGRGTFKVRGESTSYLLLTSFSSVTLDADGCRFMHSRINGLLTTVQSIDVSQSLQIVGAHQRHSGAYRD